MSPILDIVLAYELSGVSHRTMVDHPDPECEQDGIVVETEAVTICWTDVSYFFGHLIPEQWPFVPGHEYVGRVVEVGDALRGTVREGDRITYWGQTDFGGLAEYRAVRPLFPADGATAKRLGADATFDPDTQAHALRGLADDHLGAFADYVFDALPTVGGSVLGHDVRAVTWAASPPTSTRHRRRTSWTPGCATRTATCSPIPATCRPRSTAR
jgi:hypothetical protein